MIFWFAFSEPKNYPSHLASSPQGAISRRCERGVTILASLGGLGSNQDYKRDNATAGATGAEAQL